jgi:hypothetical protein
MEKMGQAAALEVEMVLDFAATTQSVLQFMPYRLATSFLLVY